MSETDEVLEVSVSDGPFALAVALDEMVEGRSIQRTRFVRELDDIGVNGEQVVGGLLATGLFEQGRTGPNEPVVLRLTPDGRLAIIHVVCCL